MAEKSLFLNPYIRVLNNKKFLAYYLSRMISRLGDIVFKVGISWYVLKISGSAVALGNALFFTYLPQFIFGFVGGYVADRFDRKTVMVISDVIRGIIVLSLLFVFVVPMQMSLYLIYGVAFILASIKLFFSPASMAFIPEIVDKEHLVTAGALSSVTIEIIDIIGNALGGFLIAVLGVVSVFLFNSFSFFIGGFLLLTISSPPKPMKNKGLGWVEEQSIEQSIEHRKEHRGEKGKKTVVKDIREGIRYTTKDYFIRTFLVLLLISNISYGIMYALPVIIVQNKLGLTATSYGIIETALALGMVIGVGVIGLFKVKKVGKLFIGGLLLSGIMLLIMGFANTMWLYVTMFFLFGLCDALTVPIYGYLQSYIRDEVKGRVFATIDMIIMFFLPFIMLLIGHMVEWFGINSLIITSGSILLISGIIGYQFKTFREASL